MGRTCDHELWCVWGSKGALWAYMGKEKTSLTQEQLPREEENPQE